MKRKRNLTEVAGVVAVALTLGNVADAGTPDIGIICPPGAFCPDPDPIPIPPPPPLPCPDWCRGDLATSEPPGCGPGDECGNA